VRGCFCTYLVKGEKTYFLHVGISYQAVEFMQMRHQLFSHTELFRWMFVAEHSETVQYPELQNTIVIEYSDRQLFLRPQLQR